VTGIETTRGTFSAPIVVNAAGAWAAGVAELVGLKIPVSIWRHDIGLLSAPPAVSLPFPMVIDYATNVYFRPEGTALVLVGLEDEGQFGGSANRQTDREAPGFPERVARRITERVPAMADAGWVSGHSGQDGITPDQKPILGSAGPDGFYLDCGHSGTGFKTAPAVGLSLSQLIVDGAPQTVDISPFTFDRFEQKRLLVSERSYDAVWQ
jgi:sarcosine oxidase subunit beta